MRLPLIIWVFFLTFGIEVLLAPPAKATDLQQLLSNLKPVEGVVVMPMGEEYIVDLDASDGIRVGDTFSVIQPGAKIIHPVTNETLGSLDETKALLRITRIKSGYSYASELLPKAKIQKGDPIRRYANFQALFWDYTGNGESVLAEIRATLPNLEWQSYADAQRLRPDQPKLLSDNQPRLYFIYRAGQLDVRGIDFQLLGEANFPPATESAPVTTAAPTPVPRVGVAAVPAGGIEQTNSKIIVANQTSNDGSLWSATKWQSNPLAVEIADFDGDGQNEIAVLFKDHLDIGRVNNRSYRAVSSIAFKMVDKALTLSSADLDGNGRPELFISGMNHIEVSSLIIAESNGAYRIVQNQLPWFLRAVREPGGNKIVLGQRLGGAISIYSPEIVRLEYRDGQYQSAGSYTRPNVAKLFSLQPFGESLFAEINYNDRLRVLTLDSATLWESSLNYGGTPVYFNQEENVGSSIQNTSIYIKPRLELLPDGTLLVPRNEGHGISKALQLSGPGQVVALQWDGTSMTELWHSKPLSGMLVDFQYADIDNDTKPELVELIHYSTSGFLSKGSAGLQVFELN